jgi:hypothetical protein
MMHAFLGFLASSEARAIVPVLLVITAASAYFGWSYYQDWKFKQGFRRYWGTRQPGRQTAYPGAQAGAKQG